MVGKIIYSKSFITQLDDLAKILYNEEYFSFIEHVDLYIDKIYDFIEKYIEYPINKNSSGKFQKHGKKYLKYTANKRTT